MTHNPDFAALCQEHGVSFTNPARKDVKTPLELLEELTTKKLTSDQIAVYRKELREELLGKRIEGNEVPDEFEMTFDGSGDSGNYNSDSGNDLVDFLLMALGEKHIYFDWYNNDGGGGDITWRLVDDVVVINGYYNVMKQVSKMTDVEV